MELPPLTVLILFSTKGNAKVLSNKKTRLIVWVVRACKNLHMNELLSSSSPLHIHILMHCMHLHSNVNTLIIACRSATQQFAHDGIGEIEKLKSANQQRSKNALASMI